MAEVESPHNGCERGVLSDGCEELSEDTRVRNRNVAVECVESRSMNRSRSKEKSHKVGISWCKAIGRDLDDEKVDNGTCDRQVSTRYVI